MVFQMESARKVIGIKRYSPRCITALLCPTSFAGHGGIEDNWRESRSPLLAQGGDFAFPAGCPRRPCPADDLWVTLKHHRKEGWLRHQRKFGEATEADAAGAVFVLDSSENHPGFSSASTIRCAKPSMAASTKGRLSVAEQPKRQRVCVTFERPFLSSSAFMTGINSTAALSPMNSGSAIAGMSETSLKSTIMIPALTPRSA